MHAQNMTTHSLHSHLNPHTFCKIKFYCVTLPRLYSTYIYQVSMYIILCILYSGYTFNSDMIHIQIGRVTSQNCIAWLAHAAATATQPEKISRPILSYSATCKLCLPHLPPIPSYWKSYSVLFHFSVSASWICTWEPWKSNSWESSWGPMNLSLLQAPSVHCPNTPWVVWQNRILINYNLKNVNLL